MPDRTNETPVNGIEHEIGRVNFLVIYSELHDRFEKREKNILYEREKDVLLGC